jgi:hypothetical protein
MQDLSCVGECTALEALDLDSCPNLVDISALTRLTSLSSLRMARLSELCYDYGEDEDDQMAYVWNCAQLTRLDLSSMDVVVDLRDLGRMADLEVLTTSLGGYQSDLEPLTALQRLRDLTLPYEGPSDPDGWLALSRCPALRSLELRYCGDAEDEFEVDGISRCALLERLVLVEGNVASFTPLALLARLRDLRVEDLERRLTEADVDAMTACQALTVLEFVACNFAEVPSPIALAPATGGVSRTVKLLGCYREHKEGELSVLEEPGAAADESMLRVEYVPGSLPRTFWMGG